MNRLTSFRICLALGGGLALAGLQQHLLQHRPPRLVQLISTTATSGPAALDLSFSRPMQRASLAQSSKLNPAMALLWLGEGTTLRLLLEPGQIINSPLTLVLRGVDQRNLALSPQRWSWDPRPYLLAVVPTADGEQLQMQSRDGRWQGLTPSFPRLASVVPLGDGSGIALSTLDGQSSHRLWLLPVQQRNLARLEPGSLGRLEEPKPAGLRSLSDQNLRYAQISSNRRGDLLVQSSTIALGEETTTFWPSQGGRTTLGIKASGPMQLLPEGGGVIVPQVEGLTLYSLPGQASRRQVLPGSRDLSSFCPMSGRALLVRHWPDYRRSLELVEPGQPPRQLWLGSEGVLASACDRGGERVWLLLSDWNNGLKPELLALNQRGRVLQRRQLMGWEQEPGTPMQFDATRQELLLTMRRKDRSPQPVLIDAATLTSRPMAKQVNLAIWLPSR